MRATMKGISWVRGAVGLPLRQFADVVFRDLLAVAIAQDRFEDQADGDGQPGNRADPGLFQSRQRIEGGAPAVAGVELLKCVKSIMCFVHGMLRWVATDGKKWPLGGAVSTLVRQGITLLHGQSTKADLELAAWEGPSRRRVGGVRSGPEATILNPWEVGLALVHGQQLEHWRQA
jgi:hypothetical protein